MRIYVGEDYAQMSAKAAEVIAQQVREKPNCVLGLATGSTPIGMYEQLRAECAQGNLDFSGVTSVNLDEYVGLEPTTIRATVILCRPICLTISTLM